MEDEKVSRPMKVLSLSNIANNAYLNAKILRGFGIENDVICHDYYHIMGCFQWEEDCSLVSYVHTPEILRRPGHAIPPAAPPAAFIQGPFILALLYLLSPPTGPRRRLLRRLLSFYARLGRKSQNSPGLLYAALERICQGPLNIISRLMRHIHAARPSARPPAAPAWDKNKILPCGETGQAADKNHAYLWANRDAWWISLLGRVLERYDIIIGYGLDGYLPWCAGQRPYCAFEHGTIRSIPFENTFQGRLCAATYQNADHVFISNCDNVVAAQKLGLKKYSFLPHPINEDIPGWLNPAELRQSLNRLHPADFWIFHPARQHWDEERHPSWEKGNDRLIHGLADAVRAGLDFAAVFVAWGRHVKKSQALLKELGLDDRVIWIDPMPHPLMVEYILATDVTADQFHLGAFGSIAPKALYLKRPVLIHLDEERHRWCLPEMPPMVNVKEPAEIARALERLAGDAAHRERTAESGHQWYMRYHSNAVIGRALLAAFDKIGFRPSGERL